MSRVYVASSWRNPHQQSVVVALREHGHEVYDFRNPPNGSGFALADGTPITKTDQIRLCGNSVSPPVARAIIAANFGNQAVHDRERVAA